MKRSEVRLLWQSRIEAFQSSVETSVAAWCVKKGISVQSMYKCKRQIAPTCFSGGAIVMLSM